VLEEIDGRRVCERSEELVGGTRMTTDESSVVCVKLLSLRRKKERKKERK
jgi:hypothetical protein